MLTRFTTIAFLLLVSVTQALSWRTPTGYLVLIEDEKGTKQNETDDWLYATTKLHVNLEEPSTITTKVTMKIDFLLRQTGWTGIQEESAEVVWCLASGEAAAGSYSCHSIWVYQTGKIQEIFSYKVFTVTSKPIFVDTSDLRK